MRGAGPGGIAPSALRGAGERLPAQVDATTCGIAALAAVAARVSNPAYLSAPPAAVERVQKRLHAVAARTGAPWPQSRGTSPWAIAVLAGRATGLDYAIRPWGRPGREALLAAVRADRDAFVFVGGGTPDPRGVRGLGPMRLLGEELAHGLDRMGLDFVSRHVVAVLGPESTAQRLLVFEPSSGRVHSLPLDALDEPDPPKRPALGYWRRPLLVVAPVRRRRDA